LAQSLTAKKIATPHEATFKAIVEKRKSKSGREAVPFQTVLQLEESATQVNAAKQYLTRLGATGSSPPVFMNGVPIKNDDDWLQTMVQRVSQDLQWIQRSIFEEALTQDMWIPSYWLNSSSIRRNPLVIPENDKDINLLNLLNIYGREEEHILETMPTIPVDEDSDRATWTQLVVVGDFDTHAGLQLILDAIKFRREHPNVEVVFVNQSVSPMIKSPRIIQFWPKEVKWTMETIQKVYRDTKALLAGSSDVDAHDGSQFWPADTEKLAHAFGFIEGENGLIMNGRKIGPIPIDSAFTKEDFTSLYEFELRKRISPASVAVTELDILGKIKTPMDAAKVCSLLAISTVSDMPEGIFELPPPLRTRVFYEWDSTETTITVGDNSSALINIVAVLDPAAELAQRWSPILKVLSKLDGVSLQLFLNPKEKLQELPVKRFYRYALEDKPSFDEDGSVTSLGVRFQGIPKDTLLTVGMDVPPSWLVAQKKSIYDLDNIKLSSLALGDNVDATYELENILIEGHTRDTSVGIPPRGAQLVLSTAKDPHFADTIVMANLGYFQFKANPGYYNITLQPGLSSKIFKLDSVGALGYEPQAGDQTTEVCLLSFQGVTLYPRFSRNPGMEEEDVLGSTKPSAAADFASKGADLVDGLLNKAGIKKTKAGEYLSKSCFDLATH
jgi:UDP-glucose:glycoprotein glucosyltransferase